MVSKGPSPQIFYYENFQTYSNVERLLQQNPMLTTCILPLTLSLLYHRPSVHPSIHLLKMHFKVNYFSIHITNQSSMFFTVC